MGELFFLAIFIIFLSIILGISWYFVVLILSPTIFIFYGLISHALLLSIGEWINKRRIRRQLEILEEEKDIDLDHFQYDKFYPEDYSFYLVGDDKNNMLYVVRQRGIEEYAYKELLHVEIYENKYRRDCSSPKDEPPPHLYPVKKWKGKRKGKGKVGSPKYRTYRIRTIIRTSDTTRPIIDLTLFNLWHSYHSKIDKSDNKRNIQKGYTFSDDAASKSNNIFNFIERAMKKAADDKLAAEKEKQILEGTYNPLTFNREAKMANKIIELARLTKLGYLTREEFEKIKKIIL